MDVYLDGEVMDISQYFFRPESLRMFMTPVSPEGNPMVDDPSAADDVRSSE